MATSCADIIRKIEENKDTIRKMGVRELGLFGSCARGNNNESSDLDFLVEFERKSFDAYMDLKFFLERLFGKPVDLVLKDALKPRLRAPILKEVVYATGF